MIYYEKTERLQQFLTGGFTAAELRRICCDNADLNPVSADIGETESVNRVADALIAFCVRRRLLPLLHQLTAAQNPKLYQEVFVELPTGYTDADLEVHLAHVRDAFALLDLRGMSGASQALSIPLEQVMWLARAVAAGLGAGGERGEGRPLAAAGGCPECARSAR
jgi:hypothetical protein